MHKYQEQIDACNSALLAVRDLIPRQLFTDVHDYINKHDEWGVGVEILVDQIYEYDIKISWQQFDSICQAMQLMELGESDCIESLRNQCVK